MKIDGSAIVDAAAGSVIAIAEDRGVDDDQSAFFENAVAHFILDGELDSILNADQLVRWMRVHYRPSDPSGEGSVTVDIVTSPTRVSQYAELCVTAQLYFGEETYTKSALVKVREPSRLFLFLQLACTWDHIPIWIEV